MVINRLYYDNGHIFLNNIHRYFLKLSLLRKMHLERENLRETL